MMEDAWHMDNVEMGREDELVVELLGSELGMGLLEGE
jgi:hypothetical protein